MANMKTVIDQLVAERHLNAEAPVEVARILAAEETSTPWYIQLAVGISAWIAALFIIGFITTGIFLTESAVAYSITGLLFCAAAVGVKRFFPRSIFAGQLTLALSLAGQGLFISGVAIGTEATIPTALATILLEVALIVLYPGTLHRFISALVIVGALLAILLVEWELYETTHALVIGLASLALMTWYKDTWFMVKGWADLSRPIGYAAVIAMFGLLVPSAITEIDFAEYWWISTLGLLVVFYALIFLMIQSDSPHLSRTVVGAVAGGAIVLALVTWQTPGILAAITMLLLGFWRGHRLLMGLAIGFLVFFIGAFYYNLDLTLLEKSWILLATGILLFIARYFLLGQFKPEQEVV
jgi:uncharacterized membrane protein